MVSVRESGSVTCENGEVRRFFILQSGGERIGADEKEAKILLRQLQKLFPEMV